MERPERDRARTARPWCRIGLAGAGLLLALLAAAAPTATASAQAPVAAADGPADPAAVLAGAVSLHQKGDVEGAVVL